MEWGEEALETQQDTGAMNGKIGKNEREFYLKRKGEGNIWGRRIKIIEDHGKHFMCI